jgi:TonB family protein
LRRASRFGLLALCLLVVSLWSTAPVRAQDRGAIQTKDQKPIYPEGLLKEERQGNVMLVGRIDARGTLSDLRVVGATHKDFVGPAAQAVEAWKFRPAMRDGKPIEIFANIGVRFRLEGEKRGLIPAPILGNLAISPADESGKRTAPEGFPIRRGADRALRAEALLDVPPYTRERTLAVQVEAISPSGRRIAIFQPPVAVPAKATEVTIAVVARVGPDWEEGVWRLRFMVDGAGAGSGQFWLARDPAHFSFVIPRS